MLAIEVSDLHKNYKGAWAPALDGFSFSVSQGRVAGLLGPNGAGKTTTINILCGLVNPDNGIAKIFGKDCIKDKTTVRNKIGVAPQQVALFGNLTATENLIYIGRLYGLNDDVIRLRAANLLDRLGLAIHAGKRINAYSGGMKRRANIIAALLHEPELLILDEPTAGVDVQSRSLILSFLKEYSSQGKSILYTSHLMDEAQQICDEVTIIDEGKFVISGTPNDLIRDTPDCKKLEDVFLHFTGHSVRD